MTFEMIQLPLLFLISYLSYKLFQTVKFPASRLVGPIIAVAILQSFGLVFAVPQVLKMGFSIVFGIYLGLRFNRDALGRLKASLAPAILISILYIGITMFYGNLLTAVSSMDQTTAFLAVIPGGVAEASVLAVSYNANLAQVSSFQLVRFLSIVVIVPLFAAWVLKPRFKDKTDPHPTAAAEDEDPIDLKMSSPNAITPELQIPDPSNLHHWIWLFVIGIIGSLLFYQIHFPAGLLIGGTFAVSLAQLLSKKPFGTPSPEFYNLAQIGMGAVIGTSFTKESLGVVSTLILPMLLLTVLILTTSIVLGFVFSKLFKMDFLTGFMAVLPGGMSAMMVLADEFDADVVTISSLQLVRLLTAVMVIPLLYQFIL